MSNYKDGMQSIANELAYERYDKDFYSLPDETQMQLMDEASTAYMERHIP